MAISLSLVMPVYNGCELVVKMWDSIIENDYRDWELIAVDDGSSLETFKTLSDYAKRDSRIQFFSRDIEPKGAQTCRNIGLEKAQGEFVIFFDSDDYITPSCLSTRVKAIRNNTDLDFMVFPSGVIKDDIFYKGEHDYAFGYPIFKDDNEAFARRFLPFIVWNNIYRTASLRRAAVMWDTKLRSLQDADFNIQCIFAGLKYQYYKGESNDNYSACPDIGYRIGVNSGSVSKKATSAEHQQSMIYAIEKFYRMYDAKYSHKYDYALYRGVLFLYNWTQSSGIVDGYVDDIADTVYRYSKFYGLLLRCQISLTRFFGHILNKKISRQIPMALHLLDYGRMLKNKNNKIRSLHKTVPANVE